MPLIQKDIDELKEIYFQEFKENISDDEAWEIGRNLIQLFSIIARPIPTKKAENQDSCNSSKKGQLSLF